MATLIQALLGSLAKELPKGCSLGNIAVTPDNDADLAKACRGVMITGPVDGGVITYVGLDGSDCVTATLLPGVFYPFGMVRIKSTGTTATGIKAHY